MSTASHDGDRIPRSQRERDRLRVLRSVLDRAGVGASGGLCPPDPPEFTALAAYARGGNKTGRRLDERSVVPWREADQRALGSHSCGALSSRWRRPDYQKRPAAPSRESSVAPKLQATDIKETNADIPRAC